MFLSRSPLARPLPRRTEAAAARRAHARRVSLARLSGWACAWAWAWAWPAAAQASGAGQASAPSRAPVARPAASQPIPRPPNHASPALQMSGDLIVKFRDSSAEGAMLSGVLNGSHTLPQATPVATRLSNELGVPLTLLRVTSGREALLAIDREALLDALAKRARQLPGVASAHVMQPTAPGLPSATASVRIEMRAKARPQGVADPLAQAGRPAPQLRTGPGGTTLLSYDMNALTAWLLQQLQGRAEVEYAQANRLLRAADPTQPR